MEKDRKEMTAQLLVCGYSYVLVTVVVFVFALDVLKVGSGRVVRNCVHLDGNCG
jgi:hypothetical protein